MYDLIYTTIYILIATFGGCCIPFNIYKIKLHNKDFIIFYLLNYCASMAFVLLGYQLLVIFFFVICTFVTFYNFNKKISSAIIACVSVLICIVISEVMAKFIWIVCFRLNLTEIDSKPMLHLGLNLILCILLYIVSKFSSRFLSVKLIPQGYVKRYRMEIILIIVSIALLFFFTWSIGFLYEYIVKSKELFMLGANGFILVFLILIIVFILSFYKNIKSQLEQKYKELEFAQITEYTSTLETMSNSLISFKHDYLNILQTIGGFIETDDILELKQFYENELLPESYETLVKDKSYMRLKHIKINPLKALISSKIISAQLLGITVNIEIIEDIEKFSMATIDICRIFGILLDNAIEAATLTEEKTINFAAIKNEKKVTFIIANSCLEDTPPVHKIYGKNFSTKGKGRGIGLKNVREIIDKKHNNIILNTKIVNLVFKQELNIYN